MKRFAIIIYILGAAYFTSLPSNGQTPDQVFGVATNGLLPTLIIPKAPDDWNLEIDYIAQTNFVRSTWLKVTNRIGSRLQLWSTNNVQIYAEDPDALAVTNLPAQTTVGEIMKAVRPRSTRGMQWLNPVPGFSSAATAFSLQHVFKIQFTNDYVLCVTPLIYEVNTNGMTADLIEFAPIRTRLGADGHVQQIN